MLNNQIPQHILTHSNSTKGLWKLLYKFMYLFRCYYNVWSMKSYGAYVGVPADPNAQ